MPITHPVTYDHRSHHVTVNQGNGRDIGDPRVRPGAQKLDPVIRFIDWDGSRGVVVYNAAERRRCSEAVHAALQAGETPDPIEREIAEYGERQIDDFSEFEFLVSDYVAAKSSPNDLDIPPPPLDAKERPDPPGRSR